MKTLKFALIAMLIVAALATVMTSETLFLSAEFAEQVITPARPAS